MILLENKYLDIYGIIIKNFSKLSQYDDIVKFKYYFSNLDKIKQFCVIEEEVKKNLYLLDQFYNVFQNIENFDYIQTKNILISCKPLYEFMNKIHSFPDFLIKKYYQEFEGLNSFKIDYEELRIINSKTPVTREIKVQMHVDKLMEAKQTQISRSRNNPFINQNQIILQEVKLFNNLPLSEMVLFKEEYSGVYEKIIKDFSKLSKHDDITKFKNYFSNLNKIKQICDIGKEFERKSEILDQFDKCFWNIKNFNFTQTNNILISSKPLYELTIKIHSFPDFLIKKFYQEFVDLTNFKEDYEELKIINSPTPVTREIRVRMHVDKLNRTKHSRIRRRKKNRFINQTQVKTTKFNNENIHEKKENKNVDLSKTDLDKIFQKVNLFNNGTFSEMVKLEDEYLEIYKIIINNYSNLSQYEDIVKFKNYFSNLDKIKDAINFINNIKEYYDDLNEFHSEINNECYLAYSDIKRLIIKFENCYKFVSQVNSYPSFLKNKITNQFNNLIYFIECYTDLNEYLKFDEISEDNKKLDVNNTIYKHNQDYVENGVKKYRKFFENIVLGKNLDDDQIKAVLTDNDATQIIAGAGTGKTLTLQGKVKFLIEEKNIPAEDILCLSYSRASKADLKDKIEKTIGKSKIKVKTFHALGSKILNINEEKCRVKKDALDHAIDLYFKNVVFKDQNLMQSIVTFFSSYFKNTSAQLNNYSSHQTIKSMIHAVDNTTNYEDMRAQDENKVTIDREYVRSVEEAVIANFLYLHGINYVYEKNFAVKNEFYEENLENYLNFLFVNCEDIPRDIKLELYEEIGINIEVLKFGFYPDFYIPDKDIYIEHFGVDRNCEARWLKTDEQKEFYKKGMEHKKKIYNENNTKLITTYSYYNQENRLTERLEEKLRENGVEINDVDYEFVFNELILNGKLKEYKLFKRVISTFINLFKGNGIYLDENGENISKIIFKKFKSDNERKNKGNLQKRNRIFLNLIEEIYEYYHNILKEHEKIDFNDMINDATIALKNGAKIHNYKYIIVDEYQDTSHMRYHLLKEIQRRTNAKITVVGDDWQSIYGFTGCDIHLFSNFKEYFKNPTIVKIQNTYRNSQALINIAGKFIQNNTQQIKKELKSTNVTYKKPVKLARYTDPIDEVLMFLHILQEINKKAIMDSKKTEVLVLGRNNFDIEEVLCPGLFTTEKHDDKIVICPEFSNVNFDISFRTIHKSKGLEADYVILLNLNDKLAGFPNKIENDPILDYVTIKKEEIRFAEERRLFYVALTRTLNDIYLLAPEKKSSEFILELEIGGYILDKIKHNFGDETLYNYIQKNIKRGKIQVPTGIRCPKCKIGEVKLIFNTKKGTKFFRCSENCGWNGGWYIGNIKDVKYARVCKKCNGMTFLMEKNGKKFRGCNFYSKRHFNS